MQRTLLRLWQPRPCTPPRRPQASRKDYLALTDQVGEPDDPDDPGIPDPGVPTYKTTKVDIVAWLLLHGVDLDEGALDNLNKSELLALVQALLDDD